jgi:hypothetical protein
MLTVPVPNRTPLSINDTEPEAVAGETVAVSVTVCPNTGAAEVVSVVVVVIEALRSALKNRTPLTIGTGRIMQISLRIEG